MKNINTVFNSITNIDKPDFQIEGANGVFTDVPALAKYAVADNAAVVTLCTFNIKTGKATTEKCKMPPIHTKAGFAAAFVGEWYRIQYAKAYEAWANLSKITEELDDEQKAKLSAVTRRYNIVRDVMNVHDAGMNAACNTVKTFVACWAGQQPKDYPSGVVNAFEGVKMAFEAIPHNDDCKPDLSNLRTVLNDMTVGLWAESDNCETYTFRANATLTNHVYQRLYSGLSKDSRNGTIKDGATNEKGGLTEIVLACFKALQNKVPAEPVDSVIPTGKKSGKKNANK